jgi:hypothetical protein
LRHTDKPHNMMDELIATIKQGVAFERPPTRPTDDPLGGGEPRSLASLGRAERTSIERTPSPLGRPRHCTHRTGGAR